MKQELIGFARASVALALCASVATATAAVGAAGRMTPTGVSPANPALFGAPSADGGAIFLGAANLDGFATPLFANFGPTSHDRSHTSEMAYDPDQKIYVTTFEGIEPGSAATPWVSITTTVSGGVVELGRSELVLGQFSAANPSPLFSRDQMVTLEDIGGVLDGKYVVVMNTVTPPGAPPQGFQVLSSAYSVQPSGAITSGQEAVLLSVDYPAAALRARDVHTVTLVRWNSNSRNWEEVPSAPGVTNAAHGNGLNSQAAAITEFGAFAVMAGTTWSDTFANFDGLAKYDAIRRTGGGALALATDATVGTVTSVAIAPDPPPARWQKIQYAAAVAEDENLTVDILSGDGAEVLMANAAAGADLGAIDAARYPSLRLRATLRSAQAGQTPLLDSWSLQWEPSAREDLFLPALEKHDSAANDAVLPAGAPDGSATTGNVPALPADARENAVGYTAPAGGEDLGCAPPDVAPLTWPTPELLAGGSDIFIAPDIAADSTGREHVVWYAAQKQILYAFKDPGAAAWSAPVAISPAGIAAWYPKIIADSDDTLHVLWNQAGDLYYASKPLSGSWSAPLNLSRAGTVHIGWHYDIVATLDRSLHVVWSDTRTGNADIYYTMKAAGAPDWEPLAPVAATPATSLGPQIVVDSRGMVHVVWHETGTGSEVFYANKAPAGGSWSAPVNVSVSAGGSQWSALAVDASDTLHLAWQDTLPLDGQSRAFIVYYATKPPDQAWSGRYELERATLLTGISGKTQPPALVVDARGAVHVAWASMVDYKVHHTMRLDAASGWSVPQAVAALTPPPNPDNQWYLLGMAADLSGGVHVVWNDMASSSSFYQAIRYTAALPPPVPDNHVLVVDGARQPLRGVCLYQNGDLVGTTNDFGILVSATLQLGDQLVAVKPLAQQISPVRGDWAYRTALTSLGILDQGNVVGHTVNTPGRQTIRLQQTRPLVYFHLLVSIQWNAEASYIQEVAAAMRAASDYLFDVSDGQMLFGEVEIFDDGMHWDEADIQVLARNQVRPHAYVGGITASDLAQKVVVGRHWDGRSGNSGDWRQPSGYRTLVHEFAHYALHLYDSYFGYEYNAAQQLTGRIRDAGCTDVITMDKDKLVYPNPATDATNASIMNYQYAASELAARDVAGLWNDGECRNTVQWQIQHESDWETVTRFFGDAQQPARWSLVTPLQTRKVMAGPPGIPPALLNLPKVMTTDTGGPAPDRLLAVLTPQGTRYELPVLVSLDTYRSDGSPLTLDQGIAMSGQITIYGGIAGDRVRAISLDGSLAGAADLSGGPDMELHLVARGGLAVEAASAQSHPYLVLIPSSSGDSLTVAVHGVGEGAAVAALLVPPGRSAGESVQLTYSPATGVYEGVTSFSAAATGLGTAHLRGIDAAANTLALDGDFALLAAPAASSGDYYSPDGNAWLRLNAGSLPGAQAYLVMMPVGTIPQPLPAGMAPLGSAYSIEASGSVSGTLQPSVLHLSSSSAATAAGSEPESLQLAWWDGMRWNLLGGDLDSTRSGLAAPITKFGIYALLGPDHGLPMAPRNYMPSLSK